MTQDAQKLNGKFAPHNLKHSTLVICCLPAYHMEQYELVLENKDEIHNNNVKKNVIILNHNQILISCVLLNKYMKKKIDL